MPEDDIFEFLPETEATNVEVLKDDVIEFVPDAPHTMEKDGELKPIIEDDVRKEVEAVVDKMYLSEREKQVLYAIRTLQYEERVSPSANRLGRIFGLSQSRIKMLTRSLVEKGFLEWSNDRSWQHKKLLFPKNIKFPWLDAAQFPTDIFDPRP